jgi:hypothetical protein
MHTPTKVRTENQDNAVTVRLTGDVCGALINLSGRRRFTSQRIVLYSVLAAQGDKDASQTAREALTLFRDAHTALLGNANGLPGVFCTDLENAYFGSLRGDTIIRSFIDLAERTLTAIETHSRQAPALLEELTRSATPTLTVLNQITTIYEEQSKQYAQQARKHLKGIMTDIETIAKEARMVSFNAQIVAARAGTAGREFAVVAGVLSGITGQIDGLVRAAMDGAV